MCRTKILQLHVHRTNQTLLGRYSDVDTTSWLIRENTRPPALPYKVELTKLNTARHRTKPEQPSGIPYCPLMVSTYTYRAYESCRSLSSERLAVKKGQSGKININPYSTGKSERLTGVMVPQGIRQPQKWTSTQVRAFNGNVNFTNSTQKIFHEIRLNTYMLTVSCHTFFHTNIRKFLFGFKKHRALISQSAEG